jgi:thioesterase domain-containing protein/acyl carrier protein
LVNFLYSMQRRPGLGAADILLSVTTVSFDIAALELFLPLITGARLVIASREVAADGRRLMEQLAACGATVMQATPTTWRMMLDAGWEEARNLKIMCGGESLPLSLARALASQSHSVWNLYGPTETTVWSSIWPVEPNCQRLSIGRPIHNTQINVLDSSGRPVPVGVVGELYIGGEGLARGYLNRPELTAEKFVPNPFGAPSSRLYRTGDLGRYLADGNIEFIGRIDNQVKVRGFRIELGEVEAVLSAHEAVSEAVVVVREEGADKRLAAYVVTRDGRSLTEKELIGYAKQKLPSYMVPSALVFLENLPLTPNGKIDRRALPAPQDGSAIDNGASPGDRLEFELIRLWRKFLRVNNVGLSDNFFELGGDSLRAASLVAEVERNFGQEIRLIDFFAAPTVEGVAALLRQSGCSTRWSSLVPIQAHGSRPPFFWVYGDASSFMLPGYLGEDQPLFGFIHQGQDGSRARYTTVESIASHYLEELCGVQPAGPYFLGGYSFGGLVAFEMAQQLASKGEEVGLLVLLEPSSPAETDGSAVIGSPRIIDDYHGSAGGSDNRADGIDLLSWQNALYAMDRSVKKLRRVVRTGTMVKAAKRGVSKLFDSYGQSIPSSLRSTYIMDVYTRALRAYKASAYAGPVVFFNTSANVKRHAVWSRLIHGDYEVHLVSGNHMDLTQEPQLSEWAGKLDAFLFERQCAVSQADSALR